MGTRRKWYPVYDLSVPDLNHIKAGNMREVTLKGRKVCLVYLEKWHAVEARCPHAGAPLAKGHCTEEAKLVCPWHRVAFNLNDGLGDSGYFIEVYPVKVENNILWVSLPKKGWFF
ncbi:MAG: Rieske (2Fe-2S) protein [Bacteroidota bacterium]